MVLIARYGEIFLKGKNRLDFERKLVKNIKNMFDVNVVRKRNRLLVDGDVDLRRVFGLISYSPAVEVDLDIGEIKTKVLELVGDKKFETFAVAAKRMASKFLSSQEMNEQIGKFVVDKLGKKVNLSNPDLTIGVEIIDDKAFVFVETVDCFGGLPAGVEGKVVLLVSDEKSLLAGLMMMKRGCSLELFSFEDFDISLLEFYSPKKLKLEKIKSLKELEKLDLPLVVGNEITGFDGVVLEPLVGLTDEEISKKISIFRLK